MKLGFHYHTPLEQKEDGLYVSGFIGLFIDSLAEIVEELTLFLHTPSGNHIGQMDYKLTQKNIKFVSLGMHTSIPKRELFSKRYVQPIKDNVNNIDYLLIRSPTPILPAIVKVVPINKIVLLIVGYYHESSHELQIPFPRKQIVRLWSWWYTYRQTKAVRKCKVMVNSQLMYNQLENIAKEIRLVKTTTLSKSSFYHRKDTCTGDVVRLIYTGRIDPAKGIEEMMEAMDILLPKYNLELHLVGWEEPGSGNLKFILDRSVEILGKNSDKVIYHGKKKIGEELNSMYRQSDIYLVCSRNSEGFPRTIWEAMSQCTPVIASKKGSIPFFLTHKESAFLLESVDKKNVSEAIDAIISNSELRQNIIRNAYELVQDNTLDVQARRMIDFIENKK